MDFLSDADPAPPHHTKSLTCRDSLLWCWKCMWHSAVEEKGLVLRTGLASHGCSCTSQFCPRAPGLTCSVAHDNADTLACMSWHTEGNIFRIALSGKLTKATSRLAMVCCPLERKQSRTDRSELFGRTEDAGLGPAEWERGVQTERQRSPLNGVLGTMFESRNACHSDYSNRLTASSLTTDLARLMTGKRPRCTVPHHQFAAAATAGT